MYDYDLAVLSAINHNRIHGLDFFFGGISDYTFCVAMLIPTLLLIVGLIKNHLPLKAMAFTLYLSYALVTLAVNAIKYSFNRTRPFVHHDFIEKLSIVSTPSFPSGHSTDAFVMAFGLSLLTRKPQFLIPVWLWAIAVGYSRMALGVHYPSDVLASIVLSFFAALMGRWLYGYIVVRGNEVN